MSTMDKENYAENTMQWGLKESSSINHNKTDFDAFKARQKRDKERSEIRHRRRMQSVIQENLEKWKNAVPERWKDADLNNEEREQSIKIKKQIQENGFCSFFLHGETGNGKTFHAYAIAKEYIRRGFISPAQVAIRNEGELLDYVNTGFKGYEKLSHLLSEKYKFFIIDDVGRGGMATQDKRNALWDRVIDYVYSNDVNFVMTSNFTVNGLTDNFSNAAFDRLLSSIGGNKRKIEFSGDNYRVRLAKKENNVVK